MTRILSTIRASDLFDLDRQSVLSPGRNILDYGRTRRHTGLANDGIQLPCPSRQDNPANPTTSRSAPGVKPVVRKPDAGKPGEKAGTASGTNFTLFTSTFQP